MSLRRARVHSVSLFSDTLTNSPRIMPETVDWVIPVISRFADRDVPPVASQGRSASHCVQRPSGWVRRLLADNRVKLKTVSKPTR